ncbi:TRP-like ion channel (transient receptor potential ion channel) [Zalerion maritima]|uniref:TRP-like ion channel (Transient receptor potential ion channel) n=1 Tax=Zalerion maritima TaxID=339359 RepID=A0AAD5WTH3_9PEZI|nr:TRP-like ion channel (transient receptor potential ion channel) [Zalerion maritima]
MIGNLRPWMVVSGLALLATILPAAAEREVGYIIGSDIDGVTRNLRLDRSPALYTRNFGDCLGGSESPLNITKFDAGVYIDNTTVVFHMDGTTSIESEAVMIHISLFAYGEEQFKMIFDPCDANIHSLCPMNANEPITAYGMWYLTPQQIKDIPSIAYNIPDFDGFTRIHIFGNSSRSLIGCFQADMSNGNSFSHPRVLTPILALFAATAVVASFLTAAYGVSTIHMRSHYAHSLSALVVFETFQTIFFSGALSIPWPKVLPSWWSNFGWAAGIIPTASILDSMDSFAGVSGNSSQVGGAAPSSEEENGAIFQEIYGRLARRFLGDATNSLVRRRARFNESNPYDYTWSGEPMHPGVSLPGSWFGFSGTLAALHTPEADAFMIGLVWLIILVVLIASSLAAFKYSLELLGHFKRIGENRLRYFRTHWTSFLILALLRTLFVSFMMIMTLSMYQFALHGAAGPTAIAAIFWVMFLVGMGGLVAYACHFRLRFGRYKADRDQVEIHRTKVWEVVPWATTHFRSTTVEKKSHSSPVYSFSCPRIRYINDNPTETTVHSDQAYVKRFGWLSARYRRTRWWFFACWLVYHFIRACFVGGARNTPAAQVYGLLVFEIICFIAIAILSPFEGRRNTALAVWMLGITKVVTTALSIALLPSSGLSAILATGVGIIIVVIQGLLVLGVLILIVLGCLSTWMSMRRNTEKFPEHLENTRVKFYEHIEATAADLPPSEKKKEDDQESPEPDKLVEPYFAVNDVRKAPKIEDEYGEPDEIPPPNLASTLYFNKASRTCSLNSRYSVGSLPKGGKARRASWSSRDFSNSWDPQYGRPDSMASTKVGSLGHSPSNSLSMQPLVEMERPAAVHMGSSMPRTQSLRSIGPHGVRPATPSMEVLEKYSQERFSHKPSTDR